MNEQEAAREVLQSRYGLSASLTRLDGDRDANFRAECAGQRYVCKLMHPDCAEAEVRRQCAALRQLAGSSLNLPRIIPSRAGAELEWTRLDGRPRMLWLLRWCPGTLLAECRPHSHPLQTSFGRVMAELALGLARLDAPLPQTGSQWELTRALDLAPLVTHIAPDTRGLARRVLEQFGATVAPELPSLPRGWIHNDANDYNVLVDTAATPARVTGLIDFGDMAWQPLVCDVAIALAYLVLHQPDPLGACGAFLGGYSARRPLSEAEIRVLFTLLQARLVVSVAISSERALREPQDPYITISQGPAREALARLAAIPAAEAEARFRAACTPGSIVPANRRPHGDTL